MSTFVSKNRLFIVGIKQRMEQSVRELFGQETFFLSAEFHSTQVQKNLLLAQVHLLVKQEKIQEIVILKDELLPEDKGIIQPEHSSRLLRELLNEDPFIQRKVSTKKLEIKTVLCLPKEQVVQTSSLVEYGSCFTKSHCHESHS